jgi:hypothetical protein
MNWEIHQIYIELLIDSGVLGKNRISFDYAPEGIHYDTFEYPQDAYYIKYRIDKDE